MDLWWAVIARLRSENEALVGRLKEFKECGAHVAASGHGGELLLFFSGWEPNLTTHIDRRKRFSCHRATAKFTNECGEDDHNHVFPCQTHALEGMSQTMLFVKNGSIPLFSKVSQSRKSWNTEYMHVDKRFLILDKVKWLLTSGRNIIETIFLW